MIRIKSNKGLLLKLSLALTTASLIIAAIAPASVHADAMQWTVIDTPSVTNNVIVSPSEINFIAAGPDGITLYALDIPHSKVYRSTNGGFAWDDITGYLTTAGAAMPAWNIAIAPDNPHIVAIVTSVGGVPRNVFISTDGGSSWQDTNCTATSNIGAIGISPNYRNYDIVVGTRNGAGGGKVIIYTLPGYSGWTDQGFTGDVLAAKFSPNYGSDSSLVIVSANAAGTFANIGIRDTVVNTTNWTTWTPVEITTSGVGTSPKANQIRTADLELPLDFVGQIPSQRHIFISTNDAGATGNAGVYRIDDNILYQLISATGTKMISSIAYIGSSSAGKMLAAEVKSNASLATVDIWFSPNAGANCPQAACIIWQKAVKPPTGGASSGNANAQVTWSPDGSRAYCGTSSANLDVAGWPNGYLTAMALDESAFSLTLDDGKSWNQIGIIDTAINSLSDVAASINSDILYLSSINTNAGLNGFDSLWRSTSYPLGRIWERVLCVLTTSNDTIVRLGLAQTAQPVFLGARNTSDLFQSNDKGQTWNKVFPGINITDFIVTEIGGIMNMFVLENNFVRRGEYTSQMWKWEMKGSTTLNSGHTITATPSGIVMVGDTTEGTVAYSIDNGAQFTRLPPIPIPGNIHAIVDPRIASNIVIYAASDAAGGKIYCWVVGASYGWIEMGAPGQSFYGLAQAGTLYGAWSSGANSGVNRTLNPEALKLPFIEWDNMAAGLSAGVVFTREPISLKISGGIDLWAIDNRPYTATTGHLWGYCDCLSPFTQPNPERPSQEVLFQAPTPTLPAMNSVIPVDSDTGETANVKFEWEHPTPANGYELWIAKDKDFNQVIIKHSITPETPTAPRWTLSSPDKSNLEAGGSYYWKVRVNRNAYYERGEGQWSETMSFSLATNPTQQPVQSSLNLLMPMDNTTNVNRSPKFSWAPVPEAIEFEFILARDKSLQQIVVSRNISDTTYDYDGELDWGNTYFWQVKVTKPFLSEASPVFSFTVATEGTGKPSSTQQMTSIPALWLWLIIAFLVIVVLVAVTITIKTKRSKSKN